MYNLTIGGDVGTVSAIPGC